MTLEKFKADLKGNLERHINFWGFEKVALSMQDVTNGYKNAVNGKAWIINGRIYNQDIRAYVPVRVYCPLQPMDEDKLYDIAYLLFNELLESPFDSFPILGTPMTPDDKLHLDVDTDYHVIIGADYITAMAQYIAGEVPLRSYFSEPKYISAITEHGRHKCEQGHRRLHILPTKYRVPEIQEYIRQKIRLHGA